MYDVEFRNQLIINSNHFHFLFFKNLKLLKLKRQIFPYMEFFAISSRQSYFIPDTLEPSHHLLIKKKE